MVTFKTPENWITKWVELRVVVLLILISRRLKFVIVQVFAVSCLVNLTMSFGFAVGQIEAVPHSSWISTVHYRSALSLCTCMHTKFFPSGC